MSFSQKYGSKGAQKSFAQVPNVTTPRSSFNRSHGHKTTFDSGHLIPILLEEILPGDTLRVNTTTFARMATPIFPIMDNVHFNTYFFFVPNRLVWENWQKFMGEQANPTDSIDFTVPGLQVGPDAGFPTSSVYDYYGLPTHEKIDDNQVSALPFRGYNLIWNEWFRDQNLQDSQAVNVADGPDQLGYYDLLKVNKFHDYFTSCLPWPQKGQDETIPFKADVDTVTTLNQAAGHTYHFTANGSAAKAGLNGTFQRIGHDSLTTGKISAVLDNSVAWDEYNYWIERKAGELDGLSASSVSTVTSATLFTINQLRQAFQIQKMLERDARSGTRYVEIIKSHFGVTSPDARLQRPEYLGGGKGHLNISAIAQTSSTDSASPQGHLSGVAIGNFSGHGFNQSFVEHGYVHGFVSVRVDLTYQNGLNKHWSRKTRLDYYWPVFQSLGEQPVLRQEIDFSNNRVINHEVFGYQERHAEYRYAPSRISGVFKSNSLTPAGAVNTLDSWHLAQNFGTVPTLSEGFIQSNAPFDRVLAVNNEPEFLADFWFEMNHTRPMPTYSVPGDMDRF